jgi:hypothetical protein
MMRENMDNALEWFFKNLFKWGIFGLIVYVCAHFIIKAW